MRECNVYADAFGSVTDRSCGQELLVGAPTGIGASEGAVYVFQAKEPVGGNYAWEELRHYDDPQVEPWGEYGFSLAVGERPQSYSKYSPWVRAGISPQWVAVGAPGGDRVEVYQVDTSTSPPGTTQLPNLVWHQTLFNPGSPANRFGHALTAGDFNGDGRVDLAVGAPAEAGGGAVYLYLGDYGDRAAMSSPELESTPLMVSSGVSAIDGAR